MNVLFGLLRPDEGEILIDGEVVAITDSGEAVRRGIGMVHQHFMLVPVFSVTENVVLGFEPTKSFNRVDYKKATDDIHRLSKQFNLDVDPDAIIENLPVGLQQRVEILKALSHDAELLILDEPTAVLTPQEIDSLMEIMRSLAAAGQVDPLHHPQAEGSKGDRGRHHGHPSGKGRGHRRAHRVGVRARLDDGGPRRQADRRKVVLRPGRRGLRDS